MSLHEKLREGLYDTKHKPRLAYARSYFLESGNRDPDLTGLEEFYLEWRNFDEYIVLQKQTDNLRIKGEVEKETIAIKCSKRGNDVYLWRVWKRLKFLDNLRERTLFNPHANVKIASIVFVTLTYDTKISSIQDAWETIGEDFNKWMRNLRKKYGRISYLRGWEASKQGYPHVHLLMFFHDYNFKVIRMKGKYRIAEKKGFEKSWHSFVDVQAVQKLKKGIKYITKYLSKYTAESQTLTLALCWLFRKRSFAVSGDFHEILYAIIKTKHQLIQIDLFRNKLKLKVEWGFIGVFSASKLGIDRNEWRKVITDKKTLSQVLNSI